MGDANTGRPSRSRYALCSCKSISTEVSARNTTAAQKNIESPRTILILRLTHLERGSRSAISGEHRLPACSSRQLAANRVVLARRWLHRLRKLHLAGSQMLQASSLGSPERSTPLWRL